MTYGVIFTGFALFAFSAGLFFAIFAMGKN